MDKVEASDGINSGFLVIGITNTFLFNGEVAHELILLNVANGEDFSMPVTEEQATILAGVAASSLDDVAQEQQTVVRPDVFSGTKEAPQL